MFSYYITKINQQILEFTIKKYYFVKNPLLSQIFSFTWKINCTVQKPYYELKYGFDVCSFFT